jgi:hypothetical protein
VSEVIDSTGSRFRIGWGDQGGRVREVLRTNDPVELSFALHVLRGAGVEPLVLDEHMSVLEGSIGALPRRVMVENGYYDKAVRVLGNVSLTNVRR